MINDVTSLGQMCQLGTTLAQSNLGANLTLGNGALGHGGRAAPASAAAGNTQVTTLQASESAVLKKLDDVADKLLAGSSSGK
eukprot:8877108-Karenia_brevis.AAC.1